MKSFDQIPDLENLQISQQLLKSWRIFMEFVVVINKFPTAPRLLNLLVAHENIKNFNLDKLIVTLNKIKKQKNSESKDLFAMNTIWDMELNPILIQTLIQIFDTPDYQLSQEHYNYISETIEKIKQLNIDPLLATALFTLSMFRILENISNKNNILRLLSLRYHKEVTFVPVPILYHNKFIDLSYMEKTQGAVTEEAVLIYLDQINKTSILGTEIIKICQEQQHILKQQMQQDPQLSKFGSDDYFFHTILGTFIFNISQIMDTFNWKRDKAARLLRKLSGSGYLIEKKLGKEKFFINKLLINIFKEIYSNKTIQDMISL